MWQTSVFLNTTSIFSWYLIPILVVIVLLIYALHDFALRFLAFRKYSKILQQGRIIDPMLEEKYRKLEIEHMKLKTQLKAIELSVKGTIVESHEPSSVKPVRDLAELVATVIQKCEQIGKNSFPLEDRREVLLFTKECNEVIKRDPKQGDRIIDTLKPEALRLLNFPEETGHEFLRQNLAQLKPKLQQLFHIIQTVVLDHSSQDKEVVDMLENLSDSWDRALGRHWHGLPNNMRDFISKHSRLCKSWDWAINPEE